MPHIPDYSLLTNSGLTRKGGGVGIYMSNKFKCIQRSDLSIFIEGIFVLMFVDIQNTSLSKAIFGIVHCQPDNFKLDDFD